MRVLLVEDDVAIARAISEGLPRFGFDVEHVTTGHEALQRHPGADLVLLDLGLPDVDGVEVCRALRAVSAVPLVIITARGDEIDQVVGLELGADDYLAKPFGLRTLVARMRAVLRRAGSPGVAAVAAGRPPAPGSGLPPAPVAAEEPQSLGDLTLDRLGRRAIVASHEVALTQKEFDLLAVLAERPGVVCGREDLLTRVWDAHWFGSTRTLDVHVGALRRKLGEQVRIETVRGVGFRLEPIT